MDGTEIAHTTQSLCIRMGKTATLILSLSQNCLTFFFTVFTSSPCFDGFESVLACTTGDLRRRLESAVSECEQYFVTTTIVVGRSDREGGERQTGCLTLHQVEENFNISMQGRLEGITYLYHTFNQLSTNTTVQWSMFGVDF